MRLRPASILRWPVAFALSCSFVSFLSSCTDSRVHTASELPHDYMVHMVHAFKPHYEPVSSCVHSNQLDDSEVFAAISNPAQLPEFSRQAHQLMDVVGVPSVERPQFDSDESYARALLAQLALTANDKSIPLVFSVGALAVVVKHQVPATEGRCTVSPEFNSFIDDVLALNPALVAG